MSAQSRTRTTSEMLGHASVAITLLGVGDEHRYAAILAPGVIK
jgi:hypothetical protein